jgi:hypothetical protein
LAAAGVAGCQGVSDEPTGAHERGDLNVDPGPVGSLFADLP